MASTPFYSCSCENMKIEMWDKPLQDDKNFNLQRIYFTAEFSLDFLISIVRDQSFLLVFHQFNNVMENVLLVENSGLPQTSVWRAASRKYQWVSSCGLCWSCRGLTGGDPASRTWCRGPGRRAASRSPPSDPGRDTWGRPGHHTSSVSSLLSR